MAFSTVVAFNRFPERASIHTVAFHRLALVGRGNNLGGFSQYDPFFQKGHSHLLPKSFHKCTTLCTCILIDLEIVISKHTLNWVGVHTLQATFKY